MNVLFWRRRHAVSDTDLNAYVDRQLTPADRDRVEEHLRACDTCRETVEELRTLGTALRELPRASAPRSFALRQEDVSPTASEPSRPWSGRLAALASAPALAGGVAVFAFFAFWTLVSVDVLTQDGGSAADSASQMREGAADFSAAEDAMAPSAPNAMDYGFSADGGATEPAEDGEKKLGDADSPTPEGGRISPSQGINETPATPESEDEFFLDESSPPPGIEGAPGDAAEPSAPDGRVPSMSEGDVESGDAPEPPAPTEPPPVAEAAADDSDGFAPLRVAEAVAAAVVLGALGSFTYLRWRRRA